MGSNQSSSISEVTNVVSQNMTNLVIEQAQNLSESQILTDSINIIFGPTSVVNNCGLVSNQTIKGGQVVSAVAQYQSTSSIVNLMTSSISATLAQSQNAVSDFLSTTFGNEQSNANINNSLNELIDTNVTNKNTSTILENTSNLLSGNFTLDGTFNCGPGQSINISQTQVSTQFVNSVMGLLTSTLMKNAQIAKTVNDANQTQASKNAGIGDAISKVLSSLGMFILLPIAILVLIFLLMGGLSKLGNIGKGKGGKGGIGSMAKMMKFKYV